MTDTGRERTVEGMAEIKLHEFTETLYDIVGDKIRDFCEKTYYGYIVFSFEQSYDGKEWTKEVEFAGFENCTDLYYETDWNEGQKYLRNLRIWHLEDSEPIKHGRNIADGYIDRTRENKHAMIFLCSECRYGFDDIYLANERDYPIEPNYCPNCGAKMDEVEE